MYSHYISLSMFALSDDFMSLAFMNVVILVLHKNYKTESHSALEIKEDIISQKSFHDTGFSENFDQF